MITLLAVLTPLALLNSLLFLPRGIAGIAATAGAERPIGTSSALIAGTFVPNLAFGLLVAVGLDVCFDQLELRARSAWQGRDALIVGLQVVIGAAMLVFAYRLSGARDRAKPDEDSPAFMTPAGAFSASFGMTLMGLPSAVLYFAAIDQTLRADLAIPGTVTALLFFNAICLLPLVLIVLFLAAFGTGSPLLATASRWVERWGGRLLLAGLLLAGSVSVADGVGWLLGWPLLPSYASGPSVMS